jgi:hypothetical protein
MALHRICVLVQAAMSGCIPPCTMRGAVMPPVTKSCHALCHRFCRRTIPVLWQHVSPTTLLQHTSGCLTGQRSKSKETVTVTGAYLRVNAQRPPPAFSNDDAIGGADIITWEPPDGPLPLAHRVSQGRGEGEGGGAGDGVRDHLLCVVVTMTQHKQDVAEVSGHGGGCSSQAGKHANCFAQVL